jgi:long-subunit acyl-CoA synthetase (AMP-forming)
VIKVAAKGFIALGLRETHAVAIMSANCPEWFATSYASIFAGGIPCGIYPTSSPEIASYICQNASADILILDDLDQLTKILNGRKNISEAFPSVNYVILVNANEESIKQGNVFKQ